MGEGNNSPIAELIVEVNAQLSKLYINYAKSIKYLGDLLGRVYGTVVYFENPEFVGSEVLLLEMYSALKGTKEDLIKIREQSEGAIEELDKIMKSIKDLIKVEDVGKVFPVYQAIKDTVRILINFIDEAVSIVDSIKDVEEVKKRIIKIEDLHTTRELDAYRIGLRLLSTISKIRHYQKLMETTYYSFLSASSLGMWIVRDVVMDYIKILKTNMDFVKELEKDVDEINRLVDEFLVELKGTKFEVLLRELKEKYKKSFDVLRKGVNSYLQEVNRVGYDVGAIKN